MSEESKKLHPRIRTYADDLNEQRRKSGLVKEAPKNAPEKNEAPPKKTGVVILEDRRGHVHIPETPILPHKHKQADTSGEIPANNTPEVSTKIPAFHEVQKQQDSSHKDSPKKSTNTTAITTQEKVLDKSEGSQPKKPSKVNIGYDAKVITDTKSNRFKLFPAIIASIKSWFHAITIKKKKSTPKYSVPETNHRKGVIQKATSKTGTIFSADNATLKEQIRKRRQHDKEAVEVESDQPETTWSPYTEPGYNLLEAPDQIPDVTKNVFVEYKKPRSPKVTQPESPITLNPEDNRWEAASTQTERISDPEVITEVLQPTSYNEESLAIEIQSAASATDIASNDYKKESKEKFKASRKSSFKILNVDTNILTLTLFIMVVGFVIILFTARLLTQQQNPESPEFTTGSVPAKSIIKNAQITSVTITSDTINQLPRLVNTTIESAPMGLVEIPIVSPFGDEMTSSYLFELLKFNTLPNFKQSITLTRFASVNHSNPVLVMKFVDEDAVRGGLLNWEKNIASDMKDLYDFKEEVTNKFTDDTIGDTDVRILRHNNETVIIYGIVDDNKILITSKVADFAQITEIGFSN